MADPLTPVSQGMRAILNLLGETPADHQKEKLTKLERKPRVKHVLHMDKRSHKLPPDAKLTPTEEIALRWASEAWRPDARVLFMRVNTCKGCGQTHHTPHWPETFIREVQTADPKAFRFTPSRSSIAAAIKLPHMIEIVETSSFSCHMCPAWQTAALSNPKKQALCLQDLLISHAAGMSSAQSQGETTLPTSSEVESFSQIQQAMFLPSTEKANPDSSVDSPAGSEPEPTIQVSTPGWISQAAGWLSARSASVQSAPATLMNSLTTALKDAVESSQSPENQST
jgi:hypothetical protein